MKKNNYTQLKFFYFFSFAIIAFHIISNNNCFSQGTSINTSGTIANSSAMLDIDATNQGILIPRLDNSQRDAIYQPAQGLLIYNKNTKKLNYYNSGWYEIGADYESTVIGTLSVTGGVSINSANNPPSSSAILDVYDLSRGLLIPRTTTTQISSPVQGLIIYDTGSNRFAYYNGTSWQATCETFISSTTGTVNQPSIGVAINTSGSPADASAMLDINVADKGILIPRLTTTQRNALLPTTGLIIYNTTTNAINYYDDGAGWYSLQQGVPPTNITSPNATICPGGNATFTLSASGTGLTYQWQFYNGSNWVNVSDGTPAGATYSGATTTTLSINGITGTGSYQYQCVTTNSCNSVTSNAATLTVTSNPVATITGNTSICTGQSTILTANGGSTYQWSNGSTNSSITVNPSTNTTYSVTASAGVGCTSSTSVTVTITSAPSVSITGTTTICSGQSTTLTASGGGTYLWNTGSSSASITVNPTTNTTYSVTVSAGSGCTNSTSATVTIASAPSVSITGTTTICSGQNTTLTASGGGTYLWSTGSTGTSITVNPTTNTTYSVTVSAGIGCTNSASVTVTVNPLPAVPVASNNGPVCAGSTLSLTATTVSGATYSWTGPNGFTSTQQNPTVSSNVTTAMAGTYFVSAIINGCASASQGTTIVTVNTPPTAPVATAGTGATLNQITANWNTSSGATTYYLDVSTNINFFTYVSGYNNLNVGNVTSKNVTGLNCGTTYYYRVRAANNCGTSSNSNTITYATSACYTLCNSSFNFNEVTSVTGNIWLDRNLGADQVATSMTDYNAYGSLYQWGRGSDGHECVIWINSTVGVPSSSTFTLSTSNSPGHSLFIKNNTSPWDWRNPQNDNLWQGAGGINNPCPSGYRVPTKSEWEDQLWLNYPTTKRYNYAIDWFNSPLKLVVQGVRFGDDGTMHDVGINSAYWSSTVSTVNSECLAIWTSMSTAQMSNNARSTGVAVRCIKN